MNKTRFQLPPRAKAATGVDHWVTGGSGVDADMEPPPDGAAEWFGLLKVPPLFDVSGLLATHCRNLEALAAAGNVAWEGAQALVRRQLEIVQHSVANVSDTLRTLATPECPRDRAVRQTETVIKAYEDAAANVRELREMVRLTNADTMEVLARRYTEAVDEMKALARNTTHSFWDCGSKPTPFWQQT